jgi:DNA-binding protein H-NS
MRRDELESMSVDELWDLREQVDVQLGSKLEAEKAKLDERLSKLRAVELNVAPKIEKRPYPKVHPKYQNPKNRKETWAGRGKQPRWLVAQLKSGKKLADFLIKQP